MAPGSFCDLRGLQVLQTARKPNSVLDDHSSRRPITEPLQQPTRRFWLPANRVSPPWRIGPIRFLPPEEERQDPCLFGLAPCGVYPAASITGRAVRSYRTFSPLPLSFARLGRYILCCTCRPDGLNHPSRTLSGTLPCGVRTFLPRSTPRGPSGSDHPAVCSFKCIAAPYLAAPEAAHNVIIDNTSRLHPGIDDHWPYKLEAALLQRSRDLL